MTKIPDSNNGRKCKYREYASKRAPGRYDLAGEKRRRKTPRGVYHDTGAFRKRKKTGLLAPRGDTKNKTKGTHVSNAGRLIQKIKKKRIHLSHAHTNMKAAAGVGRVATQQHRQGTQHRQVIEL